MPQKDYLSTPKETKAPKPSFLSGRFKKRATLPPNSQHTSVRPHEEIPPLVIDFFKIDPRTQRAYSNGEKVFYAQVLMHEIDEGTRLLRLSGRSQEADMILNFSNKMYFSHRLDLLRELLAELRLFPSKPQRVQKSFKARNNQWGAIKTRMGKHPSLAVTEIGVGYKETNEDAFLVMPSQKVLALADGMGGHVGGNIASCIAIDFFEYAIQNGMSLEESIAFGNEAILYRSKSDPSLGGMHPMGCTFAAIQIKHSLLQIAHVGDTKVMVIRNGEIHYQTQDHTQGQQLLKEGLVDNLTAFELNHILNRCLGLDAMQTKRDVALDQMSLAPGDRILLLTDGITDNFFDPKFKLNQISEISFQGSLSQAADLLVDSCYNRMTSQNLPCGRAPKPDNISLAMVEYRG